jgi:hypothetical protein
VQTSQQSHQDHSPQRALSILTPPAPSCTEVHWLSAVFFHKVSICIQELGGGVGVSVVVAGAVVVVGSGEVGDVDVDVDLTCDRGKEARSH